VGNKSEITGGGAKPPADAPVESAQPIQPETIAFQQDRARQNERELKPFAPPQRKVAVVGTGVTAAALVAANAQATKPDPTQALIDDVFGTEPTKAVSDVTAPREQAPRDLSVLPGQGQPVPALDPMQGDIDQLSDVLPELTAEDRARMPAASNTDSPAKGLLPDLTPPKGDKFDGISRGGFSDLNDAQYFPLQGDEAAELAYALADTLVAQIRNDLRFSMALVYPRIRMTLQLIVEGHAEDDNAGFVIQKIKAPKDGEKGGTPLEIAKLKADQVCFIIQAVRQEFTPDGESDQPPDALRDELGLGKPRKQLIETNGRQAFVDVVSPGSDMAALTR